MHFKPLSLLALVSLVSAQDTRSLNETLANTPELSVLSSFIALNPALQRALGDARNVTILAPSNDAFAQFGETDTGRNAANDPRLVTALLQYHVLRGTYQADDITTTSAFVPSLLEEERFADVDGGQRVQAVKVNDDVVFYSGLLSNATVSTADVNFDGGTLHIIDRVLTLPANVLDTANALNLTSFRGAVNQTDELDAATSDSVTIFAPDNDAFNAIGSALASLSADALADLVAYHIVDGLHYSTDLRDGLTLQTDHDDQTLTVSISNGAVFANAARVVRADVLIANGVLHVIDNVLNPNNTAAPEGSATAGAPGFTGTPTTGQPFTSGQPTPTTQVASSAGVGPTAAGGSAAPSDGAAVPLATGGVEFAALVGVGAVVLLGL